MQLLVTALATAFTAGGLRAAVPQRVASAPVMMPKFLKELFPNLEKPDDALASISNLFAPAPPQIDVKEPSSAIVAAGKGMPALSSIFNLEADLQALVLNLGSYDEEEVKEEIASTVASAPVVVYTYPLSPFSTEVVSILDSTGCNYKNVELGLEWFALGPKGSATRVELRKLYGQGSLPHVFIGGEWVGGLATGAQGGLAGLVESGELASKLAKAKAI